MLRSNEMQMTSLLISRIGFATSYINFGKFDKIRLGKIQSNLLFDESSFPYIPNEFGSSKN
jgi:hypothetical protein